MYATILLSQLYSNLPGCGHTIGPSLAWDTPYPMKTSAQAIIPLEKNI